MSDVQQVTAVLGRGVVAPGSLVVDADDLGLTRGDGVFDATRVVTGGSGASGVDHLDRHLARLARSIALLDGPAPDLDAWRSLVDEAVAAWTLPGEAVLKMMWTRGGESSPTPPVGMVTITPISAAALAQRAGLRLVTLNRGVASDAFHDAPWLLGGAKTLSYAVNVAAKREATRRGGDDVLFTSSDGYCPEGPTATLVAAFGREFVSTPIEGTGVLESVTWAVAREGAHLDGFLTRDRLMRPDELFHASGCWMLSSVRGGVPVVSLDGKPMPRDIALDARMAEWCGF